jgi:predicted aspartyl protease
MTGFVDDYGRALLRVTVRHPVTGAFPEFEAWVDTACTGEPVLPQRQVAALALPLGQAVTARLGDGSEVTLDTYTCLIDWFGERKQVEAIVNQGQFPLIGVGLLKGRKLAIDYPARTVILL